MFFVQVGSKAVRIPNKKEKRVQKSENALKKIIRYHVASRIKNQGALPEPRTHENRRLTDVFLYHANVRGNVQKRRNDQNNSWQRRARSHWPILSAHSVCNARGSAICGSTKTPTSTSAGRYQRG